MAICAAGIQTIGICARHSRIQKRGRRPTASAVTQRLSAPRGRISLPTSTAARNPATARTKQRSRANGFRARLINNAEIDALLNGQHSDPFALLGPHRVANGWAIRFFLPWAAEASIVIGGSSGDDNDPRPMINSMKITDAVKLRPEGFFEAMWPSNQSTAPAPGSYKIQGRTHHGEAFEMYDTYSITYFLSEFDLYLMGEGRHYDTYEKLGAHIKTVEGIRGVNFAVWAPSAKRVSVVGDFNHWDGRVNVMRARGSSGIWELFVPELKEGAIYKYEIIGPTGEMLPLKADPYAFRAELRPNTGSIVANLETYQVERHRVDQKTPAKKLV